MSEHRGASDWDTAPHILGRGRLHGAGLIDVLELLVGARPVVELVVSQEDRPVGRMVLMNGELFEADMGELEGVEALTALLRLQEGRYRLERGGLPEGQPIGNLQTLLTELGLKSSGETLLLEGELGKTSNSSMTFTDLFDLIGSSRQLLEIAVASGPVPVGWLLLQGGQLLEVRVQGSSSGTPEDTFRALLRAHHDRFAVYRRESSRPHPPLGTLSSLGDIERAEASRTPEPVRAEPRFPTFTSQPADEDTSDPPTYTPEPDGPVRPPQPQGPRVVQPGKPQSARTPALQQREREPSRTPRPAQRVASGQGGFRVDVVPPPAQKDPLERLSTQIEALHTRVSSQEDQELRLSIVQLREELARQGAQLDALSKDSSTSWWGVALGIQLLTLLLVATLLAMAWLP